MEKASGKFRQLMVIFILLMIAGAAPNLVCQERSLLLERMEKEIKESLREYGFSPEKIGKLSLSGTIEIEAPKPLPPTEGLTQKYSCTVKSAIHIIERESGKSLFTVEGLYEDIGRSESTARKYALGKVVRVIFSELKQKLISSQEEKTIGLNNTFKTMENEADIIERSVDNLSQWMDTFLGGEKR